MRVDYVNGRSFKIETAIDKLNQSRKVTRPGTAEIRSDFEVWQNYFFSTVRIDGVTPSVKRRVILRALLSSQELSRDSLLKAIRGELDKENEKPAIAYLVVFPVIGGHELLRGRIDKDGVRIDFDIDESSSLFDTVERNRAEIIKRQDWEQRYSKSTGERKSRFAYAYVRAKDPIDAFEKAEEVIERVLGAYSIEFLRGQFVFPSDAQLPMSYIYLAPCMTVHFEDGLLATDGLWYNRWVESGLRQPAPKGSQIEKASVGSTGQRNIFGLRCSERTHHDGTNRSPWLVA